MSREGSGWEWVEGYPRWAPTVANAIAELTYDTYGQEYEELHAKLTDIVRAAQRDAAEKLRKLLHAGQIPVHCEDGVDHAIELIFPDYPKEPGSE